MTKNTKYKKGMLTIEKRNQKIYDLLFVKNIGTTLGMMGYVIDHHPIPEVKEKVRHLQDEIGKILNPKEVKPYQKRETG